ncbi:invasion associated locus B family protein [Brucella anthropi]|jgi:invasion protein IalB|uniref:Invasion associated locus B family protein n=1 Tax=Brucella anthropi TaxID=529 RepID=A0A6I0DVX1_BRUAN|nr:MULTISPECIES: invasion associated locus B family protein [Brucella/Ochrobactrum group]QTN01749.1 invasion associated locus B family protein [Ochrobactrum sp. EEELCW01]KAB2741131.1 invasion associated locus B family protein [Brucella anthropi]KAB2759036.1 invasion associated locus B family protein [Brucella anthropi]KAB2768667.1 invasion associated locus B family protein [Brucella anthropi]KAB2801517.1 invasion associated locus B family protein [Brucella anthropi]
MLKKSIILSGIGMAAFAAATAYAADPTLPNGATSLREQYADWTVLCGIAADGDKKTKVCSLQQEQVRQVKNGPSQRVLAVELQPKDKGLEGVLVLPLGLKLDKGATLKIDDGQPSDANRFRTCIFAGCVVDIRADAKMAAALGKGKTIAVKTITDEGKDADFTISLNGFQNAVNRVSELMK